AISPASSLEMMPCLPSMAACALEARMSWGAKALSKPTEAFISSMIAVGDDAKRPPHILLADLSVTGSLPDVASSLSGADGQPDSWTERIEDGGRLPGHGGDSRGCWICSGIRDRRAA